MKGVFLEEVASAIFAYFAYYNVKGDEGNTSKPRTDVVIVKYVKHLSMMIELCHTITVLNVCCHI